MRRSSLLALPLLLAAFAPVPSPAAGECDEVPEAGPRACATVDAAGLLAAGLCDQVPGAPADTCGSGRGVPVDGALVDAYELSDLAALHDLQRALGTALPLSQAQLLSTHNSYNAQAYLPTVSSQDPNQYYGLADQLRMGVRQIELDVHTWFGADGDGQLPVLCHGTGPHLGCSTDRPLADGVAEIRAWLDANPGEVVLIDVESHIDGLAGYDEAAAVVEAALGDVLYRPAGAPCADHPLDVSIDDIAATGAQVLLVSSCGEGDAWGGLVHARGDWHQGRLGTFDVETCGPDYDRTTYDTAWTRYWEDTTWLSAMAGGPGPRLAGEVLEGAMACGLSIASLDRIHPDDPRLETLLWSWALDERPHEATTLSTAVLGEDGRFHVAPLTPPPLERDAVLTDVPLLCRDGDGFTVVRADVPHVAVTFHDLETLDEACGVGPLTTPRSARQMALARAAVAAAEDAEGPLGRDVLLDLHAVRDGETGTRWTAR